MMALLDRAILTTLKGEYMIVGLIIGIILGAGAMYAYNRYKLSVDISKKADASKRGSY